MWDYNETPDFIRSSEELDISDQVKDSIRSWSVGFNRQQTKKSRLYVRSPHNIFEIWDIKLPHPEANKGTSGGFRLIVFINLPEHSINSCRIFIRKDLGERGGDRKAQQRHDAYLDSLKQRLLRELDNL